MRRAGRTDQNQAAIVQALRAVGASVAITSGAGGGLPDLLVGLAGETHMLELKNPDVPRRDKQLTPAEAYFVAHWRGRPVVIVESVEDALRAIGAHA